MSTSAAIGMKMEDGSVQAVGLTSEGYPEYAGAVLCGCYKTAEQVEALLALGDLSQISGTPKFCNIFDAGEEQPTRARYTKRSTNSRGVANAFTSPNISISSTTASGASSIFTVTTPSGPTSKPLSAKRISKKGGTDRRKGPIPFCRI